MKGWDRLEGFDVIGDIHGCADQLRRLLGELGYEQGTASEAYRHRVRRAVFVGDLIDRGSQQSETVELVRSMVEFGSAQIVMGNHEFNALCWSTPAGPGASEYLRRHSHDNRVQHQEFLAVSPAERERHLAWFMSLPLWLDLGGLRVVHACWHEPSIAVARSALGSDRFTSPDQLAEASEEGSDLYKAIEVLVKGPEIDLAKLGVGPFLDKDNHVRRTARVKWWDETAKTLADGTVLHSNPVTPEGRRFVLPDGAVPAAELYLYRDAVPVIYGHYWREGEPHEKEDWTPRTACVDFSAVKGGTLVAYRWSGETEVDPANYHPHGLGVAVSPPSKTAPARDNLRGRHG